MDPEPDVAAEAPAEAAPEQPAFLTEDQFAEVARQRMADQFAPAAAETPAPEAEAQVEAPAAAPEVRRNAAGQAIDEHGKFIAEPGSEPIDTTAAEAKYASPDEAYKAATNAQALLDAQRQELGEARAEREAMRAEMEALRSGVNQRLTMPSQELDDLIDENPAKAAQVAYNQGDGERLEAALEAWYEQGDPRAAVFQARIEADYRDWQRTEAAKAAAPAPAAQEQAQPIGITEDDRPALEGVINARTDFQAVIEAHGAAVIAERPLIALALKRGSAEQKAAALTDLYDFAKMRHVTNVTNDAQEQAAVTQAERAQQARADAAVITANQGSANGTTPAFADTVRTGFIEAARAQGHMARPGQ